MKTFMLKSNECRREWYVVDAQNKTLGRLASVVARYLIGKHKTEYTPHIDSGDYVIVLNSKKIYVSGKKYNNKIYYRHTGYIGGIKKVIFKDMIKNHPERVIEIAVKGMLPKGSLGSMMYKRLKVYSGDSGGRLHKAQKPSKLLI